MTTYKVVSYDYVGDGEFEKRTQRVIKSGLSFRNAIELRKSNKTFEIIPEPKKFAKKDEIVPLTAEWFCGKIEKVGRRDKSRDLKQQGRAIQCGVVELHWTKKRIARPTSSKKDFIGCSYVQERKERLVSLITVVIILIVVGVLLWLLNSYIPMDATIKRIINIVVIVVVVLWLLSSVFGLIPALGNIRLNWR
jgi:hypothetical protein